MLIYSTTTNITLKQFRDVLIESGLSERRPMDDDVTLQGMITGANLLVTCWDGTRLVGLARSVTDFVYCCYLSDLVVNRAYQHQGIGRRLIELTEDRLGPRAKIILVAAPAAEKYYAKVGFDHLPQAWVRRKE